HLPFYKTLVEDVYKELDVHKGGVYLDAGCGTGELLSRIADEKKVKAYGIDTSHVMLNKALKKLKNPENVILVYGNLNQKLPFKDNFFDGITCVHTLYTLENPKSTLQEFYRMLKPGGKLVVSDFKKGFSYRPFIPSLKEYFLREKLEAMKLLPHFFIIGIFNVLQDIKMKKDRKEFLTKEQLEQLLTEVNFCDIKVKDTYSGQSVLISGKKLNHKSLLNLI
ncbi:MAG: methyltransferase domain-containing protein, partial [Candidatus Aenigmatarchaeota archaeon]